MGATIAGGVWSECFRAAMAAVAGRFPRRESRLLASAMTEAMLTGLETCNCWTLAEALGHVSPSRLQHFLSRGVWDNDAVRDRAAAWAAGELGESIDQSGTQLCPGSIAAGFHRGLPTDTPSRLRSQPVP
ncbi:hypothetical protein [Streptomyces sp. x-19]|uniref:hypothetical protein n=1 Tax=Streptomyces sp. x-19 TaxID=2789280 RepID=UPI0039818C0C